MSLGSVVLIPGIAGNQLVRRLLFGRFNSIVWLDYAALSAGGWRLLALDEGEQLIPGAPLPAYYGPLCDRLRGHGWQVYAPSIDWRRPISLSVVAVADYLQAWVPAPWYLLGHSRGGLLLRSLLLELAARSQLDRVARCAALGCPHQGSLSGVALLGGWQRTKLLTYALLSISETLLAGGYRRPALNAVIATWPSVYELLPRPGSTWLPAEDVDAVYTAANYIHHGLPLYPGLLTAGRASWSTRPEAPDDVPWLDVVGTGVPTPTSLTDPARLNSPASMGWSEDGDGTVPAIAAVQGDHPWIAYRGVSHDALPQDGRVIDAVSAWFLGALVV